MIHSLLQQIAHRYALMKEIRTVGTVFQQN